MNPAWQELLAADADDRRGLFLASATRIGTTVQNIEKDFWVCWTLDALFHQLKPGGPRLLFKGGTSLSKAYGLIARFSEDIDVTVFREDIGEAPTVEELESLSRKKRDLRLDAIKAACQRYIDQSLRVELQSLAQATMESVGQDPASLRVVLDDGDKARQSLLIHYPSVVEASAYVQPSVKIESGAKSALDPHRETTITPYIAPDLANPHSLAIGAVTTIDPQRTFLDKVLIVHGMTHYFTAHAKLRGDGRMSRHYYDLHCLMATPVGPTSCSDTPLIEDCVRHAKMFFHRADTGLDSATAGSFRLRPSDAMIGPLAQDYAAMANMIFGTVPDFAEVLESVARTEALLNVAVKAAPAAGPD